MPPRCLPSCQVVPEKGLIPLDVLLQATVEHVSQAVLFLEDAGDLGQALNTDVDEMSMDEQVYCPAALHASLRGSSCLCNMCAQGS